MPCSFSKLPKGHTDQSSVFEDIAKQYLMDLQDNQTTNDQEAVKTVVRQPLTGQNLSRPCQDHVKNLSRPLHTLD